MNRAGPASGPPSAPADSNLLILALDYAGQGLPVLPLFGVRKDLTCGCGNPECGRNTGKHPFRKLAPNGLKNATTDPDLVREWFTGRSYLNIGVRCDGLVVIDQDGEEGLRTWSELIAEHGDGNTLSARTGSGGGHAVYECDHADDFVSRVRFAPGLDLRAGQGAYIVAEPSRHRTGGRYRWHREWQNTLVLPGWLEAILPRRRSRPTTPPVPARTAPPGESSRYGVRALYAEIEAVRTTPEGRRNHRLFVAAANLGGLIAGGELSVVGVEEALVAAGLSAGLTPREVQGTVRSGLSRGMETSRRAPGRGRR